MYNDEDVFVFLWYVLFLSYKESFPFARRIDFFLNNERNVLFLLMVDTVNGLIIIMVNTLSFAIPKRIC